MELNEFNFMNVCRLCLRTAKDLISIFPNNQHFSDKQKMNLSTKIMTCVSIKIDPIDRGPKKICDNCIENVNKWFEFSELCRVSDSILQKYLTETTDSNKLLNSVTEKSYPVNVNLSLPEISLLSYDSLLERSVSLGSNISSILNYCFSPTENKTVHPDAQLVRNTNDFSPTAITQPSNNTEISETNIEDIQCTSEKIKKKGYDCEFCRCNFSRFSNLLRHDESEHGIISREYSCQICDRLFVSNHRLDIHKQLVHREKSFTCNTCDKVFVSAKSLNVHSRLHTEKYKCKICGYLSTSKLYLDQHLRKHNGEQITFLCKTCQKIFSHRSSLLRHENLHLKSKGKLFKCSICYLFLRSRSELSEHSKVHKSLDNVHACDICHKHYKSKKVLSVHLKRHKIATYKCSVCDKNLHSKYELRVHEGIHSNCKVFECFHCDKRFSFKNTLVRHVKKHYSRIRSDIKI